MRKKYFINSVSLQFQLKDSIPMDEFISAYIHSYTK